MLWCLMAYAQAPNAKDKPPLDIKITAASMMICLGADLPLNMEVTNRGVEQIKVSKFEMWSHFQYGYFGKNGGRGGGEGRGCFDCDQDDVVLERDKSYESSYKFPLTNEFFKDPGKYSFKLTIEGVSSNEVEFELYNCN